MSTLRVARPAYSGIAAGVTPRGASRVAEYTDPPAPPPMPRPPEPPNVSSLLDGWASGGAGGELSAGTATEGWRVA
jgi:hypothetical protein